MYKLINATWKSDPKLLTLNAENIDYEFGGVGLI